jgi:AcrR family transcriptional regulator
MGGRRRGEALPWGMEMVDGARKAKRMPKRGSKKRALVRGEPVVHGILIAALEELAHAGYRALRIEDVAARARVNKTTIYRRWPTKADLVRAALQSMGEEKLVTPNTGSLRADLLALAQAFIGLFTSLAGQGFFRVMVTEGPDSEFMAIANSVRESEKSPKVVIENAIARGEIAPGVDPELLGEIIGAFLIHKIFVHHESVDDACLERLIDMLLLGVLPPDKRKKGLKPRLRSPEL